MDWRAAFKGNYISAVEFGGKEPTLTISDVKIVKVEDEKTHKEKDKLVVFFREVDRGWIPCKTAAYCVAAIAGSNETKLWVGKRITMFSDPNVRFGAEKVEGVRVKGSPDLKAALDVTIKLPKKKPQAVKLIPTGKGAPAKQAEPEPEPIPEEPSQPDDVPGWNPEPEAATP